MAPNEYRPPEPTLTDELRRGRVLQLDNDERLMRVQVWSLAGERQNLLDLIAAVPADQFQSTFTQHNAAGPIEVKVTILR